MSNDGDDFAALAHEVKTPLAVLRGFAELLANGDDPETRRTAVPAMLVAADQLGPAVDDLLLALEIESGTLQLSHEEVRVGEAATVLGDRRLLGRALEALGSDFSTSVENGRVTVTGAVPGSRVSLYLLRTIAAAHGGDLREDAEGVALSLPAV